MPSADRLYKRAASLAVARPVTSIFGELFPNATVIRDFRMQFSIEKNLGKEPNTCEVTISNLGAPTRAEFQYKPLHVQLDAGYEGNLKRIFIGDVRWAQSRRGVVDWETKIQAGDGERTYQHARVNRSYKAGVNSKTVLADIAKSMNLSLPTTVAEALALTKQFTAGITLQGPSHKEMTRLLAPHQMSWSIQDERLQILADGAARTEQAFLISAETGMIGSPEWGPPPKKGKKPTVTAQNLLYPELTPAGLVQIKSHAINGNFRLQRIVHVGDTHGEQWYSTVEATPL